MYEWKTVYNDDTKPDKGDMTFHELPGIYQSVVRLAGFQKLTVVTEDYKVTITAKEREH